MLKSILDKFSSVPESCDVFESSSIVNTNDDLGMYNCKVSLVIFQRLEFFNSPMVRSELLEP